MIVNSIYYQARIVHKEMGQTFQDCISSESGPPGAASKRPGMGQRALGKLAPFP